jgi:hypothetical protein
MVFWSECGLRAANASSSTEDKREEKEWLVDERNSWSSREDKIQKRLFIPF